MEQKSHKVCIVGSGNWGSAISRIIGENVRKQPELFCENVTMWVHEEIIDGKKLTEIINEQHENVKYLPNYKIPTNVVAIPDIKDAAKDSDILVFVIPHQFVARTCDMLADCVKSSAIGISLIKGFEKAEDGGIELISRIIQRKLNIPVSVLMGANIASEVAAAKFCETTIASANIEHGKLFERLVRTENFRVSVIDDTETAEMCGALKNIVACGAGFMDGLGYGDNTKAAVIRIGLMEMIKFAEVFAKNSKLTTFYQSCGIADLITSCYGGRNRKVAAAFAKTKKSLKELEAEMLNGQQLQGPQTAEEVYTMLKNRNMEERFPLFTAIHRICTEELPAEKLIDYIRNHPEHM